MVLKTWQGGWEKGNEGLITGRNGYRGCGWGFIVVHFTLFTQVELGTIDILSVSQPDSGKWWCILQFYPSEAGYPGYWT